MENTNQASSKNWLQRLKDESWEAELLVSAVAIFTILKSFAVLNWLVNFFIDYLDPSQYFLGYFIVVFGFLAIGILGAMFSIHFALRAYWIGLVGLNSVFPDYGLEDSAYSPIYTKKILRVLPKISNSISKIDELCSVIFSAAFAFMLIYFFATIFSSIYLLLFNLLKDIIPHWVLFIPAALLFLLFIFGMLISVPANLKKYRSNERIQHLYFLYARWGAIAMYGPFHKSVLQITMLFGSNFKKKKGLVKMVLVMLIIGVLFGMTKLINSQYGYLIKTDITPDTTRIYDYYYHENNADAELLLAPEIQSNVISTNSISLFVPILKHETRIMGNNCGLEKKKINTDNSERQKRWKANLECYTSKINISINDQPLPIKFLKTNHSKTKQFGLSGFIPLTEIPEGLHTLKITKEVSSEIEKNWSIPFYFSPK